MYNIDKVQQCLNNLVGFRQATDPKFGKIDTDLTVSSTGIYFQGVHPLVNIENLYSIAPQFDAYEWDDYNSATVYSIGDRVKFTDGKVYESLTNSNTGNDPSIVTVSWKVVDLFSDYLKNLKLEAINKVIAKVLEVKKLNRTLKSIFENITLYEGSGRATDLIVKDGRFVFLEIYPKRQLNLNVIINTIQLQLSQANGPLPIYIYHSSQADPIFTFNVTSTKDYSFESFPLTDKILDTYGGSYYIGYYEDDLISGTQAIKKYDYNWQTGPCGSCNTYNSRVYAQWSKYARILPGYVRSDFINPVSRTIWDISKNSYDYSNNFGMNLSLSVQCEISDFICGNKNLFSSALALQVGVDVLKEIGNSIRNNAIAEKTRQLALFALDNRDNYSNGLSADLEKSIKALDFDMSGLGECLPCNTANAISYKPI